MSERPSDRGSATWWCPDTTVGFNALPEPNCWLCFQEEGSYALRPHV